MTTSQRDALMYSFCVSKVEWFTPLGCSVLCVRKQTADSGRLGLGLMSSKTLTFKQSLLFFHFLVEPCPYCLLSLSFCPSQSIHLSSPLLSVCLWWMCVCLSPLAYCWLWSLSKSCLALCFWHCQVSRNCSRQVCVCACVQSSSTKQSPVLSLYSMTMDLKGNYEQQKGV